MSAQSMPAGIVLCGGQSSRMGRSKAWLPFGNELFLPRCVRLVSRVTSPVVVVAARDQPLPPLPSESLVVFDKREGCGPLAGLAVGLKSLAGKSDTAFLTSCDAPLLVPAFVSRMVELLADFDLVLPRVGENLYPLAAVYRVSLWSLADRLLESGERRLLDLPAICRSRPIGPEEFQDIDPRFDSLRNINTPADYAELLEERRPPL